MKLSSYLTLSALVVIIKRLCDPAGAARGALEGSPFTAPHVPLLDVLVGELEVAQVSGSALDEQIAALVVELGLDDADNDRQVGGLWRCLEGAAMLAQDDDVALSAALEAVEQELEQGGVTSLTRARYDNIGGEAARRAKQVSAEGRTAMASVVIGKKTLLDYFDGWVALAEELSANEAQRQLLIHANKSAPRMTSAQLAQLKRSAIERIERLLTGLEDSAIAPEIKDEIIVPIKAASDAAAAARVAARGGEA